VIVDTVVWFIHNIQLIIDIVCVFAFAMVGALITYFLVMRVTGWIAKRK